MGFSRAFPYPSLPPPRWIGHEGHEAHKARTELGLASFAALAVKLTEVGPYRSNSRSAAGSVTCTIVGEAADQSSTPTSSR